MKALLFTLISSVMLFSACYTKKAATAETGSITGKKWQLIELGGKPVAATINGKVPFIQFDEADQRYSASAGCNGLGGTYTLSGNGQLKFTQGMSTMMACDHMEIENGFKSMLGEVDNYTISGNTLSLNKARMAPLARFELVADESAELNGTWEVDYLAGTSAAFDELFPNQKPSITFNVSEGKAAGNGGCNRFTTAITLDGHAISFGPAAATRMACPGEGEPTFFKTLETITTYDVTDNTLNLISGDIAVMRLQKK